MADFRKSMKGKNFNAQEEQQLCRTFLNISEDPTVSTGQKSKAFWERVRIHYNANRPCGCGTRPYRILETKWCDIKADVAKFSGVHASVVALNESGTSEEDVLMKSYELYKCKHPKNADLKYVYCWEILKEVPKWASYCDGDKSGAAMKKRNSLEEISTSIVSGSANEVEILEAKEQTSDSNVLPSRLKGNKAAKEDIKSLHITNLHEKHRRRQLQK